MNRRDEQENEYTQYWLATERKLFDKIGIKGSRVLDAGCGDAFPVFKLLDTKNTDYQGFDISGDAITRARARIPNGVFWVQDAEKPFEAPSNHYDFVFSLGLLHHVSVTSEEHVINEINRVLVQGGKLLLQEPIKTSSDFEHPIIQNKLFRLLEQNGFTIIYQRETHSSFSGLIRKFYPAEDNETFWKVVLWLDDKLFARFLPCLNLDVIAIKSKRMR